MKKLMLNSVLLFSFLLFFSNCNEPEVDINNLDDFEAFLEEEMDAQDVPALSVLIFKADNILYENYLGSAQIEQDIPLESDHLFLLASISKVITATALLQLSEEGLFSLDDSINDYLPFAVTIPDYTTNITFRMLLTHTSGIADSEEISNQYYYGEDSPIALGDFLESYFVENGSFYNKNENFYDFEPGTKHEYSNMGNALIGLLVEEISGIDFNEYCKQNIFNPLGMSHTFWRLDEITQTIVQPYDYQNGDYQAVEHYTFTDYPNGGLRSTSRDLAIFLSAFVQGGIANNYQLLTANTISSMIKPQIPNLDNEMGLHLFQVNSANNLWGHDGGEQGVSTVMGFNPMTKTGAILLSNKEDVDLDDILMEAYQLGLDL